MKVILTHEQADFDALASLLAASLLDENAIPVLPRRLNRNCRAFLTLYGAELPFVDQRDLPAGIIDSVLLVDTQSLVSLKGMGTTLKVQVIDHHQPRQDLPGHWKVGVERSGACTTLFNDELRERVVPLTLSQASLLLLGIYEDTGSLTYASTTPADVRAAAELLEQGASLQTLVEFLNPRLSPEQHRVCDLLLASAETHTIQGQTVVVTRMATGEMTDEISSVAHKLRDILDPDALFLLVATKEGVRLVARSTSERINVARVTAEFGGGGHERAASALVRPNSTQNPYNPDEALESVYQDLLAVLHSQISPAITVSQIMSHHPRLVSTTTTAQEAAILMQRYGYEGFPVVKNGKVVGLLTRRAVDRALSHKLNLAAASLMDSGQVTITPDESLEHLQRLMTSSGWGQIPVIAPNNSEIIGIVTRTDVLRSLTPRFGTPVHLNLASKLDGALPPAHLALLRVIASRAQRHHFPISIVGGFVRDLLLDHPGLDFDIVVEGDAILLCHDLTDEFGGRYIFHSRFGTAKWTLIEIRTALAKKIEAIISEDPQFSSPDSSIDLNPGTLPDTIDLISARTEFYERPTALPTVERSGIKLDLHRRDFTINTLALRLDGHHYGELLDFWGGLKDLRNGLVRVLHSLSFVDDPTRLLRAVRFEQRFKFNIETRTLELMKEALPLLKQVSGDRLRHEFDLILVEESASAMLARLKELGILAAIYPDLTWDDTLAGLLPVTLSSFNPEWQLPSSSGGIPAVKLISYLIWLSSLSETAILGLARRLRFPAILANLLIRAHQIVLDLPSIVTAPPSQIYDRLVAYSPLALATVYRLLGPGDLSRPIKDYLTQYRHITPFTTGETLQSLGLSPSPAFRPILKAARDAWLNGKIRTAAEEHSLVMDLLNHLDNANASKE